MNHNDRLNKLCPSCHCYGTTECYVKDERSLIACVGCGFQVSALDTDFPDVVWAWNALPRPKPKAKARKAGRKP